MSTVDLLEVLPDTPAPGSSVPIALTPEAVYESRRRGIHPRLITDFYRTAELTAREASYWQEELGWFDLFDELLCRELPELGETGLRPAILFGRWLKLVLDTVFIRGFELASALSALDGIDEFVLWRRAQAETPLEATNLQFDGPSVYSRLLPMFCTHSGAAFAERIVEPDDPRRPRLQLPDSLRETAGGLWREARLVIAPRGHPGGLTFLILHGGYDTQPLLMAALARGHRCLICEGDGVVDVSGRRPRKVATLRPAGRDGRFAAAAQAITAEGSQLWDWPDGWFGVPVSQVLRPRLARFVEHIVPQLITLADQFQTLYDREGVDYVVTPFLGKPFHDYAAVHAAGQTDGVQRVQIEHGDTSSDAAALALFNLFHFDHYFATTDEIAGYFRRCHNDYTRPLARVHVGSYRWRRNQRLTERARWRRAPARFPTSRPVVVYAVTALAGDQRYMNNSFYADPWYYDLQTRIIDVLARDQRFNFVIKLFPGSAAFTGPIDRYVADKRVSHLRTSRKQFVRWLPWTDRVIVDLPSTALYESAVAGVPFLGMLYDGLAYRPGAVEELAPWMTWFHDASDAERAVAEFLDLKPERPELRPMGRDILTTLEELAARCSRLAGGDHIAGLEQLHNPRSALLRRQSDGLDS